ncbi:gene transfer agent family protein [Agrobacterium sp. InxBP2]|uniref:gene transfer agent family protein n=1 Tax=Agrobacterium sp. InxBP2 TaxID=2870329 RepID=UPI00249DC069|nr:gene transfer agent family protein [Agrobacterium sp. InxBP2]MCW8279858.1 gene transfer agent family protein [Agrobacterium sp. InxBP2]
MRDARIELTIWDGDYEFRLGWGEIAQLQEKCDAGPLVVLHRLEHKLWRSEDIEATLRLGLIGAGRKPEEATKLIKDHVRTRPVGEYALAAQAVLVAAVYGAPEEPVGEGDAASQIEHSLTTSLTES